MGSLSLILYKDLKRSSLGLLVVAIPLFEDCLWFRINDFFVGRRVHPFCVHPTKGLHITANKSILAKLTTLQIITYISQSKKLFFTCRPISLNIHYIKMFRIRVADLNEIYFLRHVQISVHGNRLGLI
jgi:hypothetical protein